jgi:hypothetical protein
VTPLKSGNRLEHAARRNRSVTEFYDFEGASGLRDLVIARRQTDEVAQAFGAGVGEDGV